VGASTPASRWEEKDEPPDPPADELDEPCDDEPPEPANELDELSDDEPPTWELPPEELFLLEEDAPEPPEWPWLDDPPLPPEPVEDVPGELEHAKTQAK
jgi:hypothetical protein